MDENNSKLAARTGQETNSMSIKTLNWIEELSVLQAKLISNFNQKKECVNFKDAEEIAIAIKNGTILQPIHIKLSLTCAMAMTANRYVLDDKYKFMDKLFETMELLIRNQPNHFSVDLILNKIMQLAFISQTPNDMLSYIQQDINSLVI